MIAAAPDDSANTAARKVGPQIAIFWSPWLVKSQFKNAVDS